MSMTEPPVPHEPPVLNRQPHIRVAKSSYGGGLLRKLNASIRSNWYQWVARASAARPRHPAPAVAGVSVEIKRIGQVIDLTRFPGHYLIPIHGLDMKKMHHYRFSLCA